MIPKNISRILVYTHNSIGLGHVFRTLAVITGIRKWRPDIDFLVLSGTSVPHIFMRKGIEVVKLPGILKAVDEAGSPLKPRYLRNLSVDEILKFRRTVIRESFFFFRPDVVMVEHYLSGLSGEITPFFTEKASCRGTAKDFALVHLSRGIMGEDWNTVMDTDRRNTGAKYSELYDFRYVFDDPVSIDGEVTRQNMPVRYLGRIAENNLSELTDQETVLNRFRLSEKPIILMYLSRHGDISGLSKSLMSAITTACLNRKYQIIMVADPYLNPQTVEEIMTDSRYRDVRFLPFFYPLIDLIHAAELVICRAGYNIVNEILLTDSKALVIPEHHPSGEQEERARRLPLDNICVLTEEAVLASPPTHVLCDLIDRKKTALHLNFDKYAIGKTIIDDLENWITGNTAHDCLT
jgi:predicted glycosyltransferase